MSGRGGCFKRQSPAANQAALVGSQREAEPRRAPRRALRSAPVHTTANNTGTCSPAATFRGAAAPCPPRPAPATSPLCPACPSMLFFFFLLFFKKKKILLSVSSFLRVFNFFFFELGKKSGNSPKTLFPSSRGDRRCWGRCCAQLAGRWAAGEAQRLPPVLLPCPAGSSPRRRGATCPRCSPAAPRRAPVPLRVIWLVQQLHRD